MATTELERIVQKREFNPQQEVSQGKPDPGILLAGAGIWQQVRSGKSGMTSYWVNSWSLNRLRGFRDVPVPTHED